MIRQFACNSVVMYLVSVQSSPQCLSHIVACRICYMMPFIMSCSSLATYNYDCPAVMLVSWSFCSLADGSFFTAQSWRSLGRLSPTFATFDSDSDLCMYVRHLGGGPSVKKSGNQKHHTFGDFGQHCNLCKYPYQHFFIDWKKTYSVAQ